MNKSVFYKNQACSEAQGYDRIEVFKNGFANRLNYAVKISENVKTASLKLYLQRKIRNQYKVKV